jgi:LmbE family N-acetylglucosaminyl deacetylase
MRRVLFISPHLDDAVFSCATRILREAERGATVTVATVFSHVRRGSAQTRDYAGRREEDRTALQRLGAQPRWLRFFDAPSRDRFYDSFRRLVLGTAPSDARSLDAIRDKLNRVIDDVAPDTLYLPLAVGTHIDHRLVFAAGLSLRVKSARFFYEDQPYASVRHAVETRLQAIAAAFERNASATIVAGANDRSALGAEDRLQLIDEFMRSFRAAPYVRRYLPAGHQRNECEELLRQRLQAAGQLGIRWKSEVECAGVSDRSSVLAAIFAYGSQATAFLGSRRRFLAGCRNYARTLGLRCWRVERFWRIPNQTTTDTDGNKIARAAKHGR